MTGSTMIRIDKKTREHLRHIAARESDKRGYRVTVVGIIREWVDSYYGWR